MIYDTLTDTASPHDVIQYRYMMRIHTKTIIMIIIFMQKPTTLFNILKIIPIRTYVAHTFEFPHMLRVCVYQRRILIFCLKCACLYAIMRFKWSAHKIIMRPGASHARARWFSRSNAPWMLIQWSSVPWSGWNRQPLTRVNLEKDKIIMRLISNSTITLDEWVSMPLPPS